MFHRLFGNRRLFILLLSVILLLVTMGMTRGERENVTWAEASVKNIAAWVSGWFSRPTHAVSAWVEEWNQFGSLQAENEKLRYHKDAYIQLQSQIAALKRENRELKKSLNYIREHPVDTVTARVLARSPDRWNNRVVIDRGTRDGVMKDMPVITHEGLIGRVTAATKYMADVQLLTDAGSGPGIAAHIQTGKKEVFGLIEGYDPKRERLLMKKIPSHAKLSRGQPVVTSGLSDIYTGDLLIGTVDTVTIGEFGVDQMVYVKPAARFERLDYVMVVRNPAKLQLKKHRETVDAQEEREGNEE